MDLAEFVGRTGSVLKGSSSQAAFAKTLFEMILPDEREDLLEGKSKNTWKNYYYGRYFGHYAKMIINAINPVIFEKNIKEYDNKTKQRLCEAFSDVVPNASKKDIGKELGLLFEAIIREAAGLPVQKYQNLEQRNLAAEYRNLVNSQPNTHLEKCDPLLKYIEKATAYFSMKKTLLYVEQKKPFYSMYVCSDLLLHRARGRGIRALDGGERKKDVTVSKLEKSSRQNIVEGTGGIGKSMFLTHLFLSSAHEYSSGGKLPVLCLLKNYKEKHPDLETFILKTINEFVPDVTRDELEKKLEQDQLIVLLDGLDEVKSDFKESFDDNLEVFVKNYQNCTVVLTSRPITDFVSYSSFNVYDISPLRKEQAVELIKQLEFWDEEAKGSFLIDLEKRLYRSHNEFASNPLLLTIMLMTYTRHGDIPSKMHVFYAQAYETMAHLHDKSKGLPRTLYTGLTPERFKTFVSAFCARTFMKEQAAFTKDEALEHLNIAIREVTKDTSYTGLNLSSADFLKDLTDNLCIMYCEGDKYHFIHRSFQEYLAINYFMSNERVLYQVGRFFDARDESMFYDSVIKMMFDMNADKVERLMYYPCLEKRFVEYNQNAPDEYLGYLLKEYPNISFNIGEVEDPDSTFSEVLLYTNILETKELGGLYYFEKPIWPYASHCKILDRYFWVYNEFYGEDSDAEALFHHRIDSDGRYMILVNEESVTEEYKRQFGEPEESGCIYYVEIRQLIEDMKNEREGVRDFYSYLSSETFPLFIEYKKVKDYYQQLKSRTEKREYSVSLFDD